MASMVGDIMRHGPHHSAQKSTRTGASEFRTSLSQPASVNVSVFAPAILFAIAPLINRCIQRQNDSTRPKPPVQLHILAGRGIPRKVFLHTPLHPANPL